MLGWRAYQIDISTNAYKDRVIQKERRTKKNDRKRKRGREFDASNAFNIFKYKRKKKRLKTSWKMNRPRCL